MSANTSIRFRDWLKQRMADPTFRAEWEASEPAYQVARLRVLRGLTQEQLAELVSTKQSSIARLESGRTEPRLSFLRRVVEALGGRLEVRIVPQEQVLAPRHLPTADSQAEGAEPIPVHNWPLPGDRIDVIDRATDTSDSSIPVRTAT